MNAKRYRVGLMLECSEFLSIGVFSPKMLRYNPNYIATAIC